MMDDECLTMNDELWTDNEQFIVHHYPFIIKYPLSMLEQNNGILREFLINRNDFKKSALFNSTLAL